ncbi:IS6 family transposase, partial [Streptomyces sp. NPDC007205]
RREYPMQGFRRVGTTQRFLASFSRNSPHFRPRRHLMTAPDYRTQTTKRFTIWHQITGTTLMATTA